MRKINLSQAKEGIEVEYNIFISVASPYSKLYYNGNLKTK